MEVVFGPEIFGQRFGGISRYYLELHRRLPALGVTSTIVAGAHQNAYLHAAGRVRGVLVPARLQRERLRATRDRTNDLLARAYLRTRPASAIYHQTYYQGSAGGRRRGPVTITAYDLVHAKLPEHFPADDQTVAQQRRAFARADLILSISHTTKADLVEVLGINDAKIVVTHLGVSPPPAVPTAESGVDAPYLLYVGQRYGYKNWDRFVRAVAASGLADDLLVVCAGAELTATEVALVADLGMSRRVVRVAADDARLDALYRDAVTFVYPSLYEGFGLPPLEAMARGCPVVASDTGSVPEVLGDAAVYADPCDVDSLAAALVEATRPERRAELGRVGREAAAAYTWERTAEATVVAYRSLG